ncbi:MAG: phage holin family protein [Lentimicrobium sp.]|jgi:uncharacterized membrane protein YvlD (DUF360 family)|nr:phage holin family protein [Lentimicrobium sp.]MDD2526908.1 phage holin family protein [Lentimicrobiaceae bacterium]MDD4598153.1 phage holin family protein [Lentimicrobiaceae bacterium]MDY0025231.1 phage holin family protein [Lentimicrobium sp.]
MIFPLRLLFTSLIILISVYLIPGLYTDNLLTALGTSAVIAMVITLVKPFFLIIIHQKISLKIYGFTMLVACVFTVYLASIIFEGFVVNHFFAAFGLGVVVTGLSVVMTSMIPSE